jgi:hypothetical protein
LWETLKSPCGRFAKTLPMDSTLHYALAMQDIIIIIIIIIQKSVSFNIWE